MALNSDNFVNAHVTDQLMTDFRRDNPLLNLLMDSAASRGVLQRALAAGGPGGFAKKLTLPLMKQAALSPTDGYTSVSSFPSAIENPDLSSAYPIPTDEAIPYNINHVAVGTRFLPELQKWTHASGDLLQDALVQADLQEIRDTIEEAVCTELVSVGVLAAGGAQTKFPVVTTSQSALLGDLADLQGEFNRQNVPRDDRWIVLNSKHEGIAVEYDGLASRDFPGVGDRAEGRVFRVGGMNLLFTNSMPAGSGAALTTSAFALVMPKGIQVEVLRDKDRIGDYTRLYAMFGFGALKEVVDAADGVTPADNVERAGIISLAVT